MAHEQAATHPRPATRTGARSRVRRAAIIGAATLCLAAGGLRSAPGPRPSWFSNWLAPLPGTAHLAQAGNPLASMSEASIDVASLLVLGLSLLGGGHIIRRLRRRPESQPAQAEQTMPSRAPLAAVREGLRRVAR